MKLGECLLTGEAEQGQESLVLKVAVCKLMDVRWDPLPSLDGTQHVCDFLHESPVWAPGSLLSALLHLWHTAVIWWECG